MNRLTEMPSAVRDKGISYGGSRWQTSALFLFGLALTAAYWPYIAGAATTPRWVVLALALIPVPFLGRGRITWAHITGAAFALWAILSWHWSESLDTQDWLLKLLILCGAFILGSRITDIRPFWIGAALGIAVSSALIAMECFAPLDLFGLYHRHGWHDLTVWPGGLFVNGLYYAEATILVGVALASDRRWLLAALTIVPAFALLPVVPRGPAIALIVTGMAWLLARGWKPGLFGCGAIVAASLAGAALLRPETVRLRLDMWRDVLAAYEPWGYGYGSYHALIPFHSTYFDASQNLEVGPHNEFLGILFELGWPGLFLGLAFCGILIWSCGAAAQYAALSITSSPAGRGMYKSEAMNAPLGSPLKEVMVEDDRVAPITQGSFLVLLAFLTEALFGFGFHLPVTGALFCIAAGHASRRLPHWSLASALRRIGIRERHGRDRRAIIAGQPDISGTELSLGVQVSRRTSEAAIRLG